VDGTQRPDPVDGQRRNVHRPGAGEQKPLLVNVVRERGEQLPPGQPFGLGELVHLARFLAEPNQGDPVGAHLRAHPGLAELSASGQLPGGKGFRVGQLPVAGQAAADEPQQPRE